MVIDLKSQYNAILGVTAQAALGIVASIPHQKIKFSTPAGIACIENKPELFLKVIERKRRENATKSKGVSPREVKKVKTDEKEAEGIAMIGTLSFHSTRAGFKRSRRARRLAAETKHIDIVIESLHDREVPDIRPNDALEDVVINPEYPGQTIKVGLEIPADERKTLIELLRKSLDIFAWTVEDMEGISREVIEHELNVDPTFARVLQKERYFSPEKKAAIREEVNKLLKAKIISPIKYPRWLANVVMVTKANGKWRMCIDFTNMNKACPKDCYPFPRIDQLVDSIAGHRILSFIDALQSRIKETE